ncbi:hypothetical protein FAF44_13825 [Nonomuraea sp. MG754425]|uniref:hypothetical protein n=1 Tax=Nonomuraea sp. MG754425 TaxID=2570319 RepID=UPI001F41F2BE|nr:hypothetical protein [Nonomuraea sp. MG754425]MCF6469462.1 hypothetical protein [Nonomuraea sp. MG754425]
MTRKQPGPQDPDPNQTIRLRVPRPGSAAQGPPQPPSTQQPPSAQQPPSTRRLPYTPDMLPDVPLYEAKPSRSGWWWAIVAGGLVLLLAAVAVVALLWGRSTADAGSGSRASGTSAAVTFR